MTLAAGSRLGPYEVLGPLGAGGMGEVVRARDTRLDRVVALKVLPPDAAGDPGRRLRFEREARAVAALSHPHICTLHDVGHENGVDFLVMECLEGRTLAERLEEGPLPLAQALRCASEIAAALEEAHRHGIVHRDLKPGNVMLTRAGAKLLDFGVARLREAPVTGVDGLTRTADGTGVSLTLGGATPGTLPYMAPEQLEGGTTDARTDLFAFGALLYEMVTGRPAFAARSRAAVIAAILDADPPPLSGFRPDLPPGLEKLVRTCLAKDTEERWQTAREVRLALQWIADGAPAPIHAGRRAGALRAWWRVAGALLAAGAVLALAAWLAGARRPELSTSFRRLTFGRGNILQARFARDGQTILYGAAWEGRPAEVFLARTDGTGARSLALPSADVLAISPADVMAVVLKHGSLVAPTGGGMLTLVPLTGGAPREVLDDVTRADFGPGGRDLAVVHSVGGTQRIEYPVGHVLYRTPFWIRSMRVSPDGGHVAFVENTRDTLCSLAVVDRSGDVTVLASDWSDLMRVAWLGDEVVFGGGPRYSERALRTATLSGRMRTLIASAGSNLQVHDVSADGRLLVERAIDYHGIAARAPGESAERDLSWLGASFVQDLSGDGRELLFTEDEEGGGPEGTVYLRRMDGTPPVNLGSGSALALSPDGRWALAVTRDARRQLVLLPTGAGEPRALANGDVVPLAEAAFLPGDDGVVFAGTRDRRAPRLWRLDLAGGAPRPLTPEGVARGLALSPDGRAVAANGSAGDGGIFPLDGGPRRPVAGLAPADEPIQWSADGAALFVVRRGELPLRIERLDLATGGRTPWRELAPADPRVLRIKTVALSRDGLAWAYSWDSALASDLFVVELR